MKTVIFTNLIALTCHIINLILTILNGATLLSQTAAWILTIFYTIAFIVMIILCDKQARRIDAIEGLIFKGDDDEKDI